jgi:hypothetical protein
MGMMPIGMMLSQIMLIGITLVFRALRMSQPINYDSGESS